MYIQILATLKKLKIKKKWQQFAESYDRVADALRELVKSVQYGAAEKYDLIETDSKTEINIIPYDEDTFEDFQSSYNELEQAHRIHNFNHITQTVEVN